MYLEIYPDVVFILNFIVDFILLVLLKAVNRKKSSTHRLLSAAVIGALSAVCVSLTPWFMNTKVIAAAGSFGPVFVQGMMLIVKVGALLMMLFVSFGKMKGIELLKQIIALLLLSYIIGGLMNSIYYYTDIREYLLNLGNQLILSNLSVWFIIPVTLGILLLGIGLIALYRIYQRNSRETYEVELFLETERVNTTGLYDTGNCLYDPMNHKPVMVVEEGIMEALISGEWGIKFQAARDYLSQTEAVKAEEAAARDEFTESADLANKFLRRVRIIPYSSVGKAKGTMLGLMLDKVLIHKGEETVCREKVIAAVCDWRLSPKEEYHVILHKDFL